MKRAVATVVVMLLTALGGFAASPAKAYSEACTDGNPTWERGVTLLHSPVYLAVGVWQSTSPTSVRICYRTPAAPGTAGGWVVADVFPSTAGTYGAAGSARCESDAGVRHPVNCRVPFAASTTPTYSTSGGTITVSIPFGVCSGACASAWPNVAKTGVVVGTLVPAAGPSGSTGVAYQVSKVEVWLDGVLLVSRDGLALGGAFIDYNLPGVSLPTPGGSNPPCIAGGVCTMPSGQLAVTGATQTVTLYWPTGGSAAVPVTVPSRCLVNFNGPCVECDPTGTVCPTKIVYVGGSHDSRSHVAVSSDGNAYGQTGAPLPSAVPTVVVSGSGYASGDIAVSLTGNADGRILSVCPNGYCS